MCNYAGPFSFMTTFIIVCVRSATLFTVYLLTVRVPTLTACLYIDMDLFLYTYITQIVPFCTHYTLILIS